MPVVPDQIDDAHMDTGSPQSDGVSRFVERHPLGAVLAFTLVYAVGSYCAASWTPMWYDELWTYYLARLPDLRSIWQAIADGIEYNPPLSFFLTHASQLLFGVSEAATRLPAIVGFWLGSVSLFFFVRRRAGPVCGFVAMLCPSFTYAEIHATEARPYAVVLGFTGLALLCWQRAVDSERRRWALAGLTLSVAALVTLHYYAIYVAAALALAELARTTGEKGKVDVPIWSCLVAGSTPLLLLLPLMRRLGATKEQFWATPSMSTLVETYSGLIAPAFGVMLVVIAFTALPSESALAARRSGPDPNGFRRHEWVACALLLAMPLAVYLAAVFVTNAYWPKYVLPSVVGFTGLLSMSIDRIGRCYGKLPGVVLRTGFAFFVAGQVWQVWCFAVAPKPALLVQQMEWVPVKGDLPVVIDDEQQFIRVAHYGTPEMKKRVYFLNDRHAAVKHVGSDTIPRTVNVGRRLYPLNIADYASFVRENTVFFLVRNSSRRGWTAKQLLEDGAELRLVDFQKQRRFDGAEAATYLVRMPGARQ